MRKIKAILHCKNDISDSQIEKLKRSLENEAVIIPKDFEVISIKEDKYRILTKDMYIEHRLCGMKPWNVSKATINTLHEHWEKTRNGYEFVILAGDMFYSVDYFNKYILGSKEKKSL